jgi:hypothetical protein
MSSEKFTETTTEINALLEQLTTTTDSESQSALMEYSGLTD